MTTASLSTNIYEATTVYSVFAFGGTALQLQQQQEVVLEGIGGQSVSEDIAEGGLGGWFTLQGSSQNWPSAGLGLGRVPLGSCLSRTHCQPHPVWPTD